MVRIDRVDAESADRWERETFEMAERVCRIACVPPVGDFDADECLGACLERHGGRSGSKLGASNGAALNDRVKAATDPLAQGAGLCLRGG